MNPEESSDNQEGSGADKTCRFRKANGSLCRNRVRPDRKFCYRHVHGLRRKWRALTRSQTLIFLIALVGIMVTSISVFIQPVLAFLPGPSVGAVISGLRITAGNPKGCVVYMLNLYTGEEEVENLYVRIQFPGDIASYNVGTGSAAIFDTGTNSIKAFEVGKKPQGDCEVVHATGEPNPEIHTLKEGAGLISLQVSRALPNWTISGVFALSLKEPSFHPANMYTHGTYEYRKLGFSIRKSMKFTNTGIQATK